MASRNMPVLLREYFVSLLAGRLGARAQPRARSRGA
jgi:hypothetical protein